MLTFDKHTIQHSVLLFMRLAHLVELKFMSLCKRLGNEAFDCAYGVRLMVTGKLF